MSFAVPVQSQTEQTSASPRWLLAMLLAVLAHSAPLLLLTIPLPVRPPDELPTIAVEFEDEAELPRAVSKNDSPSAVVTPQKPVVPIAPSFQSPPPKPAVAPEKAPAPEVVEKAQPAEKAFKAPELLDTPSPSAAFDESKSTKEEPKDKFYLSDRTSTAADRGPKNLPRGDPFMKGESTAIRYQQKRGEGNTPVLDSKAGAGSVKLEGSPDAGAGSPLDERVPDRKLPGGAVPEKTATDRPVQTVPVVTDATNKVVPLEAPAAQSKKAGVDAEPDGTQKVGVTEQPRVIAPEKPSELQTPPPAATVTPERRELETKKPVDELAEFQALLDGRRGKSGRGGEEGNKPGISARPGEKGHEGDGTLRPGHDEAVSDITTINLESSAEEFDEARFAKKFDARTAYIKPLARRIDAKWKAEIIARSRTRLVRGVVTMKIKLRKDGKLLDASEYSRDKSMPDEYVNMPKVAIEAAANPKHDPFPPALQDKESIEFLFNFLY